MNPPIIKIEGRSGCHLDVINTNGIHTVRKTSNSIEYNERLKEQVKKQINFQQSEYILTPKIINEGVADHLYYFEMPYIFGDKFSDFFSRSDVKAIEGFSYRIISYINENLKSSKITESPKKDILNKLEEIADKLSLNKDDRFFYEYIEHMRDCIPNESIPLGYCHGDLTLSNIIFENQNRIFFLDFLDSFIESPLMDLVKLRQDTLFHWSLMIDHKTESHKKNKVIQALGYVDEKIVSHFLKDKLYRNWYDYLQKLNWLRIVPYLKNQHEKAFVADCLKTLRPNE